MAPDGRIIVPIDWGPIEEAVVESAHEITQYLHLPTGSVVRTIDGHTSLERVTAMGRSSDFMRLEPVGSRQQFRWMEEFIETIADARVGAQLSSALVGRGCFRRFKDTLIPHPGEMRRWIEFRRSRLRAVITIWFESNGLSPVSIAPRFRPADVALQELTTRSIEDSRARVAAIAESLGTGDLAALTALAQFLLIRKEVRRLERDRHSGIDRAIDENPPHAAESEDGVARGAAP